MVNLKQKSIPPRTDLREMLREYIVGRSLDCMDAAEERRRQALSSNANVAEYQDKIRSSLHAIYGELPAGPSAPPPQAEPVSSSTHDGFRIENVLFDSFPGWQVNATVYVPTEHEPPFPAVVVPVGHTGKQFKSYQLPCQYFARAGYVAVCFDPPGQASEKKPGNDHFNDGVRDYLLGRTSSRYFLADALRCIDYLETREDVDTSSGVAMTGVSGGGTTTSFAVHFDDRIAVIGTSCCIEPLADLDISNCYAGCPETHQIGRYSEGIDEVDLICATAPLTCMVMTGRTDEVYQLEEVEKLSAVVADFYRALEASDKYEFFIDDSGHAYTLNQAREFTRFMDRWLGAKPNNRHLPNIDDPGFEILPYDELRCNPRTDVNMRTSAVAEADQLAQSWSNDPQTIREAAAEIAGVDRTVAEPEAETGEPFQAWLHDWRSVMLRPEPGIELPGTLLTARDYDNVPTLLHFDDCGRHRLLYRKGLLGRAVRFADRNQQNFNLFTVDLRGWGDTSPGMYPYEIASWGGTDRFLAYASAALADPLMSMRIRDALAALAWLRKQENVNADRIILTGCGLGAVVAMHAAAIDNQVDGLLAWDGLSSLRSLLAAEKYPWTADAFIPHTLRHYDLPSLATAINCPIRLHGMRDGEGNVLESDNQELQDWRRAGNVAVAASTETADLLASVDDLAERSRGFDCLRRKEPFLWTNPAWQPVAKCLDRLPLKFADMEAAQARLHRFAPVLQKLFPKLAPANGIIDSELLPTPSLGERILPSAAERLFVKADHALPVAGSIKARGGIYAVLNIAEKLALENGILTGFEDDYLKLVETKTREVFSQHTVSVGSTGNLGLSIGISASAFGFRVIVHMSSDAAAWKKKKLRECGVKVVEHDCDYTAACEKARQEAAPDPNNHFIDDENSTELFLGYATALFSLKQQLTAANINVDREHPLFLYLPCGVGGAPGGITFGARNLFGDNVHCFFAEPVEAPCVTLGMVSEKYADISVSALDLNRRTIADGLAVGAPSRLMESLVKPLVSGCFTVCDEQMRQHLLDMYETEGVEVEPSAAAGCTGPQWLLESDAGREYLEKHGLDSRLATAHHIVWTTGGSMVPKEERKV